MSRDIVDAAVMQKFKEYLAKKGFVKTSSEVRVRRDTKRHEQPKKLTMNETIEEFENFINEYYPGAKAPPNEIVELMTSPYPSKGPIIYLFNGSCLSVH